MHSLTLNTQRRLQRQTAAMWLFVLTYAMSASYANFHVHDIPHEHASGFNHKLHQYVQSLKLDDHADLWESDFHECTACKFQINPLIPDASGSITILRTDSDVREPLVQFVSTSTPTKRLTRAPPVA